MSYIIEGNLVKEEETVWQQILIDQFTGTIKSVGNYFGEPNLVFGKNNLIFPGFIDVHTHCREDPSQKQSYKENFSTVSLAAINGGVTCIADMPNNPHPPIDDYSYQKKEELTKKSLIPILLYAGIGPGTRPLTKNVPYKVFMGPSIGELYFESTSQLEETLEHYQGKHISFHCEDPEILKQHQHLHTHQKRRPPEAEIEGVIKAIELTKKYKLFTKICHVSTAETINLCKEAKSKGINLTIECSPSHLYPYQNNLLHQINPPTRTKQDQESLLTALKDGTIDYLATDHAPHTMQEKIKGISGMPFLDTYSQFTTWLMQEHKFTAQDIMRICTTNPGNFINQFLPDFYGKIEPGYIASLTIINTQQKNKIEKKKLFTKCKWSPLENIIFPGKSTAVIIKGKKYINY